MQDKDNLLVEVSGGIASGKTTFASIFKNSFMTPIYENFKDSLFWSAFYKNPGKYIFETEISFILLHYHQIKKVIEAKITKNICDFSFLLDLSYAKIGLSGSQLKTFECVLNELRNELPAPNLYVYLKCDAKTQVKRIENRQRPEESGITVDFLDSLNIALKAEIENLGPRKVITINSAEKDFAHIESIQAEMIDLIELALPISQ